MMSDLTHKKQEPSSSWNFLNDFGAFIPRDKGRHYIFGSGIELLYMDFFARRRSQHVFCISQAPVIFSFHLSGVGNGTISTTLSRETSMACKSGKVFISHNPDSICRTDLYSPQQYRIINIYISGETLAELLDGQGSFAPQQLRPLVEKGRESSCNITGSMTPHIRVLVDQLFNSPYQGILRQRFLETKCIEIILRQLWEMCGRRPANDTIHLHQQDKKRIRQARRILVSDLIHPPSLKELAKTAGLNESKLKRGFKHLYGTTVFEYFRMYRIQKAKNLLDRGSLNIDETAHILGFCDTTHFIKNFKAHFGTTPGAYLKSGRP